MLRRLAATTALLLLAACKVERTPRSFYDRQPAAAEQDAAAAELRARVRAFGSGLERGDKAAAASALSPTGDAIVFGLRSDEGQALTGGAGLRAALDEIPVPAPLAARTPDLTVRANLKGNLGWFSTHLEMLPTGPEGHFARLRVSGAFMRDGGEWHLAEIHLSQPVPEPAPPAADSAAAADTTRRDSARKDSARKDSARKDSVRRSPSPRRGGRGARG
ncbi:MAG: hypothetical protein JWM27_1486 [Gemmatimonadetes bacterium]|nr:hypothetical protein [Gemmatimonadota bacterium]